MLVDPAVELLLIEIARHDQRGIVGPVEILVEGAGVRQAGGIEVADRADAGTLIGMVDEDVLEQMVALQPAIGFGEHALAHLFLDDVALGIEHRLIEHRAAHPLGMRPQHRLELVGGDDLVIAGRVGRG